MNAGWMCLVLNGMAFSCAACDVQPSTIHLLDRVLPVVQSFVRLARGEAMGGDVQTVLPGSAPLLLTQRWEYVMAMGN